MCPRIVRNHTDKTLDRPHKTEFCIVKVRVRKRLNMTFIHGVLRMHLLSIQLNNLRDMPRPMLLDIYSAAGSLLSMMAAIARLGISS